MLKFCEKGTNIAFFIAIIFVILAVLGVACALLISGFGWFMAKAFGILAGAAFIIDLILMLAALYFDLFDD